MYYTKEIRRKKQVNLMGKYQLDTKGKTAVSKYHEKRTPIKKDKKEQLDQLRADYLKKKEAKEKK